MKLNIIVPTYNRDQSLRETLESFLEADIPENLEILVTVVDNNSTDDTAKVVGELNDRFSAIKLEYLFEEKQGRSFALNSGIEKSDGDLISGIDDDEKIDGRWFVEVEKIFRERWNEIEFVGGKILPLFESEPPSWIEPLKQGVICWRDFGDEEWFYGKDSPMITGGHGIFKRSLLERIGLYDENVGAQGKGFISGEDEVLFHQLLDLEVVGVYNPKLVIYHYVPTYRLSKNYYRRWLFGVGISRYLADRNYKPIKGARIFGVPRWMYRSAFDGIKSKISNILKRNETESLSAENQTVIFAGFFYAAHFENSFLEKPLQFLGETFFRSSQR